LATQKLGGYLDRELFEKLYVEGKSYAEIGEAFGGKDKSFVYNWAKRLNLVDKRKRYEDLSGRQYGKLTVRKYIRSGRYPDGGTYHLWECKCSCGRVLTVRSGNLKNGAESCKACATQGLSEKLRKYPIDNKVWHRIKDRCRARGLDLDITPKYLYELYEAQDGKCALSGVPIFFGRLRRDETTASPDRIDPKKGYIKGNVRWVHKVVNGMRNVLSDEDLVGWCKNIVDHHATVLRVEGSGAGGLHSGIGDLA
jgi:hypothetical protein